MKSGTGDDPFAEESDDAQEPDQAAHAGDDTVEETSDADVDTASGNGDDTGDSPASEAADSTTGPSDDATADPVDPADAGDAVDSADIPWVLRRSGVKDDRPNMTQFFLRDATDAAEREFQRAVEDRLEKDVYLLDLREAAYQVAMEHPDEVAEVLQEWGYDYL